MMKGRVPGHQAARPEHLKAKEFADEVSWDFVGPFPVSFSGNKWSLNAVDELTSWPFCYPCKEKGEAGSQLELFCQTLKPPKRVRADNAPEFKGQNTKWRQVAAEQRPPTIVDYSAPYTPQQNGKAERWNQTSCNAVRCILHGVDLRCWDYAYRFVAYVFARVSRKGPKSSPYFKRHGREASTKHFRRFGCLAYAKQHVPGGKLDAKYVRGVFLGYGTENSTYLVGTWVQDNRCADGVRFSVIECRACAFDESITIGKIEDLQKFSKGTFVPYTLPDALGDSIFEEKSQVAPGESDPSPAGASDVPEGGGSVMEGRNTVETSDMLDDTPLEEQQEENLIGDEVAPEAVDLEAENQAGPEAPAEDDQPPADPAPVGQDLPAAPQADSGNVVKKKRGRKPGTKAQPHWRKPGRKPKQVAAKAKAAPKRQPAGADLVQMLLAEVKLKNSSPEALKLTRKASGGAEEFSAKRRKESPSEVESGLASSLQGAVLTVSAEDPDLQEAAASYCSALDEVSIEFQVMVTKKSAFSGPDATKWIEADTLERTRLEALKCWRPLREGEFDPATDEVIPAVCIYSRKRCGRYKCRLVALGNRQKQVFSHEVYSPTISGGANRFLLVEAAAQGHHLRQFDVTNAFIQAALTDERAIVRLPAHWSKSPKGDLVMLLKSLYGLRIAPRKWYDRFSKGLKSLGWVMCPREPGLFRKELPSGTITMAIFVDDSLMSGPCPKTLDEEKSKALKLFPGTIIAPEMDGDVETRDVLGMVVKYDRPKRWLKMSMEQAVSKLLKKFNMDDCKPAPSPCVAGDLREGGSAESFPLRSLVGGVQYIAHQTRPDIVFATQRVARGQEAPTTSAVEAGKRILAYLKGTKDQGLEYSPERDRAPVA